MHTLNSTGEKPHPFLVPLFIWIGSDGVSSLMMKIMTLFSASWCLIQDISRLVDITAGGNFLGLCDKKKVHINMCPILDGCGVMTA